MPNFKDFFGQLGGRRNGGNRRVLDAMMRPCPWVWTPSFRWVARILARDLALNQAAATLQTTLITIAAANFEAGTATVTFSGGPLADPIVLTVLADVSDTNVTLGAALDAAIDANPTLAAAANTVGNAAGIVTITWVEGQGLIDVSAEYENAQQTTVQFAGTLVDGPYVSTFSGGGLGAPVEVTTTRAGGVPANAAAMAVQHEADIEALVGTTLAGVVQSADDDGTDLCTIVMDPNIAAVAVETLPPRQTFDLTVGGTADNGIYSGRINHSSLPNGYQPYSFTAAGETNTQIASGLEDDIESNGALLAVVESANNTAEVAEVVTLEGVSGVTLTNEDAPGTGTLGSTETSPTMATALLELDPALITVAQFASFDLNVVGKRPFPTHAIRGICSMERITSFGVGRLAYVGNTADADGILESTSVATTGRVVAADSVAEYQPRYEAAYLPRLTIELGSSVALTEGSLEVQIAFKPAPGPRIAA